MISKTVRIDQQTWEVLKELAGLLGEPMQKVLAQAIEAHRRQLILEKSNAAFAALRGDSEAWQEEQTERGEWDTTLSDGLAET